MIAYFNDAFVNAEKASLKITDLSIQRGYAVFDFFRIKDYKPLFLEDYLDRFFLSCKTMRLDPVRSRQEVKDIVRELIRQNEIAEAGIKLLLTGGYSDDGYTPAQPNLVITQHEINLTSPEKFKAGIHVITHSYQRELSSVKSTNYLMGVWLQEKLKAQGAADVLYYFNNEVSEFPRSNVFIVTKENKILTPAENVLTGITRGKILELASKKYSCEATTITPEELKNAAEVFMTSTTKRILPVVRIDDKVIGEGQPGPVTTDLAEAFLETETSYINEFRW